MLYTRENKTCQKLSRASKANKEVAKDNLVMCTGLNVSSESLRQRERVSPSDRLRRTAYIPNVRFRTRPCISTLSTPHTTFIALFRVRMNDPPNTVDTKRASVSYTRRNTWANRLSSSSHQRNCKACNTLEKIPDNITSLNSCPIKKGDTSSLSSS